MLKQKNTHKKSPCSCIIYCFSKLFNNKFSNLNASLTLEASIATPCFIFFLVTVIYIFKILDIQNFINSSLEEAARKTNLHAYSISVFNSLSADSKNSILNEPDYKSSVLEKSLDTALVKNFFLTDDVVNYLDNSYIVDGSHGLKFFLSEDGYFSDCLDFNISYRISLPFIPEKLFSIYVNQRCYFKTFVGEDITDKTGGFTEYVYVTPTGTVYHTSPYCSYLSKSYTVLSGSSFDDLLKDTSAYKPCSNCARNTPIGSNCLMCPDSLVYHTDPSCHYLNASVYKVTYESIKNRMPLCSRCKKGVN